MSQYTRLELAVGGFVVVGIAALGYLSLSIGQLRPWSPPHYTLRARFASVGQLKLNAPVKVAGVAVGKVSAIDLEDYVAVARLEIRRSLVLPRDTVASIRTAGLLGESYVSLSVGGSKKKLSDGDVIAQTEPAVDLIHLLIQYGLKSKEGEGEKTGGPPPL